MSNQLSPGLLAGTSVLLEETGGGKYQVRATVGTSTFLVDEAIAVGGLGSGPDPYDLLSAALGSCTLMTVRLYADHKKWPLQHISVKVTHHRPSLQAKDVFTREIALEGPLDAAQKARMLEIAERCPVHLTLSRGSQVETVMAPDGGKPDGSPPSEDEHMKCMEEACIDPASGP
jgi:putative redox protein